MYNVDKYFDFDSEKKAETKSKKKKKQQQQMILFLLLVAGIAYYYFMVYLPEEEIKKLETKLQAELDRVKNAKSDDEAEVLDENLPNLAEMANVLAKSSNALTTSLELLNQRIQEMKQQIQISMTGSENTTTIVATVAVGIATGGASLAVQAAAIGGAYLVGSAIDSDNKKKENENKQLNLKGEISKQIKEEINNLQNERSQEASQLNTLDQNIAQKQSKLNDPNVSESEKVQIRSELASLVSQRSSSQTRIKGLDEKIESLIKQGNKAVTGGGGLSLLEMDHNTKLIIGAIIFLHSFNNYVSFRTQAREELTEIEKITNLQEQNQKVNSAFEKHSRNLLNAQGLLNSHNINGEVSMNDFWDYSGIVNKLKEIKAKYEEESNKNDTNSANILNSLNYCSECKKTITGQYFQKDGKKFCSQHCFDEYCLCDNCARGLICEICYRGVCSECYQPNPENYYYHREKVDNNKFCSEDCFINHYEKELAQEKKIQNHEETLVELKKLSKERKDMTNDFNQGLNDYGQGYSPEQLVNDNSYVRKQKEKDIKGKEPQLINNEQKLREEYCSCKQASNSSFLQSPPFNHCKPQQTITNIIHHESFCYNQVKEWIGAGLNPNDANFASYLKELGYIPQADLILPMRADQLTLLDIRDNNFSEKDLSMFSHLINLQTLYIGNTNQEKVNQDISNTDINSGVESLPDSLRLIEHSVKERPESRVKEISLQLVLFTNKEKEVTWKEIGFSQEEIKT
ncbi:9779_t:CDS:10 [Funneliformis geosporum]|nr:9779_t:CDS:10 [Funneliformis geosporum]